MQNIYIYSIAYTIMYYCSITYVLYCDILLYALIYYYIWLYTTIYYILLYTIIQDCYTYRLMDGWMDRSTDRQTDDRYIVFIGNTYVYNIYAFIFMCFCEFHSTPNRPTTCWTMDFAAGCLHCCTGPIATAWRRSDVGRTSLDELWPRAGCLGCAFGGRELPSHSPEKWLRLTWKMTVCYW